MEAPKFPALRKLGRAIDEFRKINTNTEITSTLVQVFLAVAEKEGRTFIEIANITGVATSTVSRVMGVLGEYGSRGSQPLNLVVMKPNLQDRRERLCYLTHKGRMLAESLQEILK